MEWIVDFFDMILSGFQAVADFITMGVFELFRLFGEFLYSFLKMGLYDYLALCCGVIAFLYPLVFGELNLVGPILDSWTSLNPEIKLALVFFRVPQIVNIYFAALAFRLIRSIVPFI